MDTSDNLHAIILITETLTIVEKQLISKSIFPIALESHFETQKSEFSDIENPKIYFFTSKSQFFFDQNLDFVLGRRLQELVANDYGHMNAAFAAAFVQLSSGPCRDLGDDIVSSSFIQKHKKVELSETQTQKLRRAYDKTAEQIGNFLNQVWTNTSVIRSEKVTELKQQAKEIDDLFKVLQSKWEIARHEPFRHMQAALDKAFDGHYPGQNNPDKKNYHSSGGDDPPWVLIGCCSGAGVLLIIVIWVLCCCCKRKKKKVEAAKSQSQSQTQVQAQPVSNSNIPHPVPTMSMPHMQQQPQPMYQPQMQQNQMQQPMYGPPPVTMAPPMQQQPNSQPPAMLKTF